LVDLNILDPIYLVDFCTIIIGEINMINNVDEHPIPPIWRYEKLIRLKTGCHATPLYCLLWTFDACDFAQHHTLCMTLVFAGRS